MLKRDKQKEELWEKRWVLSGSLRGQGFELPPINDEQAAKTIYAALVSIGPLVVVKRIEYLTNIWEEEYKEAIGTTTDLLKKEAVLKELVEIVEDVIGELEEPNPHVDYDQLSMLTNKTIAAKEVLL